MPADHWTLSTDDTQIEIRAGHESVIVARLQDSAAGHNWAGAGLTFPLMSRIWAGDRELPLRWEYVEGKHDAKADTLMLSFRNADPQLSLRSVWRARPGHGPVEHWVEIENRAANRLTVGPQDSLALHGLEPGESAVVWWMRRGGGNASTQGGTTTEAISGNLDLNLVSDCRDGASPVPWLAVQVAQQRGLYVGWEFSGIGRVRATAAGAPDRLDVLVGLLPDFRTDIEPGETLRVPPAFVGCYRGDIDAGSYALHRFILEKLRPPVPADFPDPTLAYNLYLDAGGDRASEADVLASAARCEELGFETFVPDAMWFPHVGDWRWDPRRFPRGSTPIQEYVHRQGMRLGLWCAWTNGGCSDDPGALNVRRTPTWFAEDFAADWRPGAFIGGRLCLASADARAWAERTTQALIAAHGVDYFKVDIDPIVTVCNKDTHRHRHGSDVSYWATLGYYRVQEQLRQAFPRLVLENCSGGGHIKDFGVVQRTHYTVTTDTLSNLPDRQSIYDSTFAFPPLLLQAYTYDNYYRVLGDAPASFLWRSGMMSAWQIDPTDALTWTDEQRAQARRSVEIYKTWIRPILADVQVHHILPRPDGRHWDGLFYWSPPLQRGTLYIFRPDSAEAAQTVKLKGLERGRSYWLWCEDGSIAPGERAGAALMDDGLRIELARPYTSDLIYLQDGARGKPAGMVSPEAVRLSTPVLSADPWAATARLAWSPVTSARNYRVVVSRSPEFADTLNEVWVCLPQVTVTGLPGETKLYWRVESIGWGGRCWDADQPATFKTPALAKLTGVTFVSDLEWVTATAGADNPVRRDVNYYGQPVAIGGRKYPKAVWTHAFNDATPADVVIDIAGRGFTRFAADVGVDDAANGGSVQFQVLVDGQVRAESPVLLLGAVHPLRVDVAGAKLVTLRVLNGGDGYACDHAAWGLARFSVAGANDP